jgi:hypothetical protein
MQAFASRKTNAPPAFALLSFELVTLRLDFLAGAFQRI